MIIKFKYHNYNEYKDFRITKFMPLVEQQSFYIDILRTYTEVWVNLSSYSGDNTFIDEGIKKFKKIMRKKKLKRILNENL